jgi:hypothetical protein
VELSFANLITFDKPITTHGPAQERGSITNLTLMLNYTFKNRMEDGRRHRVCDCPRRFSGSAGTRTSAGTRRTGRENGAP